MHKQHDQRRLPKAASIIDSTLADIHPPALPANTRTPLPRLIHPVKAAGRHRIADLGIARPQAKLTVGAPNDVYEQEADRVARQVVAMPDTQVARQEVPEEEEQELAQTKPVISQITSLAQRQDLPEEDEEEELVQASATPGTTPRVSAEMEQRIDSLEGGGQSLPETERDFFEPRFGTGFGDVRIHVGSEAHQQATELRAQAFTVGRDIFFRNGTYDPGSTGGRELMAHELTHVVQQTGDTAQPKLIQRDPPTTTIDFEPEVITIYNLGAAGRRPYDVIQDHVTSVSTALNNMRINELGAIEQFLTHMAFESSSAAKPDLLGAMFKAVGKALWEEAIGRLPAVAGIPAKDIIDVVTAMADELERASKAQASYNVANFITTLRAATLAAYQQSITQIQLTGRRQLNQEFGALEGDWDPSSTTVSGEQGEFLRELDERGDAILRAVPEPIAFEEALISSWITSDTAGGAGFTENFLDMFANGSVRLRYDTEEENGSYTYELLSAELYTASNSGNAADMFNRVIQSQGKKIYEIGVPVVVELRTEGIAGGRSFYPFTIRSREDYDTESFWGPATRAWNHMPWSAIDSVTSVTGAD